MCCLRPLRPASGCRLIGPTPPVLPTVGNHVPFTLRRRIFHHGHITHWDCIFHVNMIGPRRNIEFELDELPGLDIHDPTPTNIDSWQRNAHPHLDSPHCNSTGQPVLRRRQWGSQPYSPHTPQHEFNRRAAPTSQHRQRPGEITSGRSDYYASLHFPRSTTGPSGSLHLPAVPMDSQGHEGGRATCVFIPCVPRHTMAFRVPHLLPHLPSRTPTQISTRSTPRPPQQHSRTSTHQRRPRLQTLSSARGPTTP